MTEERFAKTARRYGASIVMAACLAVAVLCLIRSDLLRAKPVSLSGAKSSATLAALVRLERLSKNQMLVSRENEPKLRRALTDLEGNLEGELQRYVILQLLLENLFTHMHLFLCLYKKIIRHFASRL
jgi:hypothetical protein